MSNTLKHRTNVAGGTAPSVTVGVAHSPSAPSASRASVQKPESRRFLMTIRSRLSDSLLVKVVLFSIMMTVQL